MLLILPWPEEMETRKTMHHSGVRTWIHKAAHVRWQVFFKCHFMSKFALCHCPKHDTTGWNHGEKSNDYDESPRDPQQLIGHSARTPLLWKLDRNGILRTIDRDACTHHYIRYRESNWHSTKKVPATTEQHKHSKELVSK